MVGHVCNKCWRLRPCEVHPSREPFVGASASSSLYGTSRWKKLRASHLKKEPDCRHCKIDGTKTPAKVVDHTIRHRNNPDLFWAEDNLASLCWRHSNIKTGRETQGVPDPYSQAPDVKVPYTYTLVTGPPCAGKTTYILENMTEGDVMIDFDRIGQAISPTSPNYEYPEHVREVVRVMRLAAIKHMETTQSEAHLWVIDTALENHEEALERYRALGARVVELDPGMEMCLERAATERPARISALIRAWYENKNKSSFGGLPHHSRRLYGFPGGVSRG